MRIQLDILRTAPGEAPRWQSFLYETEDETATVATALTALNDDPDLRDTAGEASAPIGWECSCLQKKCGACAMVVNGRPGLACDTRLRELKQPVRLEPLRKFPVVRDLIVDRSILFRDLEELHLWFEGDARGGDRSVDPAYEASRCLQCGCCLEVCPNFAPGGRFKGMAGAVPMTRLLTQLPEGQRKEAARLYRRQVYGGCGKSLACRDICPAGIPIDDLLVSSNAIAVWKRMRP